MKLEEIDRALEFVKNNIPEHVEIIKEALENRKTKELHKKLINYRTLKDENINLKRRYTELETRATKITPSYSETGSSGGGFDEGKTAIAGEMGELARQIENNILQTEIEIMEIEEILSKIDDSQIRQIIRYKFEDGFTWGQIATKMGALDESYPRKIYSRWLNREA